MNQIFAALGGVALVVGLYVAMLLFSRKPKTRELPQMRRFVVYTHPTDEDTGDRRCYLRRGTEANWNDETKNTGILKGEVVYCTDTGEIKVGDGVHKWADLPTAARRES